MVDKAEDVAGFEDAEAVAGTVAFGAEDAGISASPSWESSDSSGSAFCAAANDRCRGRLSASDFFLGWMACAVDVRCHTLTCASSPENAASTPRRLGDHAMLAILGSAGSVPVGLSSERMSQILMWPSSENVAIWSGWKGSKVTPFTARVWAMTERTALSLMRMSNRRSHLAPVPVARQRGCEDHQSTATAASEVEIWKAGSEAAKEDSEGATLKKSATTGRPERRGSGEKAEEEEETEE